MNNGHGTFSRPGYLNTPANLYEKQFDPASIKNDNGASAMIKTVCCKWNQQIHPLIKVRHKGIEDFLNCAPMFLFFSFDEIEGVSRYTK